MAVVFLASFPPVLAAATRSVLEIVSIESGERQIVFQSEDLLESPNWTHDGASLVYNSVGSLFRIALAAAAMPERIETRFAVRCDNAHAISPDGMQIAISDMVEEQRHNIYVLPIGGGLPRRVTPAGPSYAHGWSPDGRSIVYCAGRGNEFEVFAIAVAGGAEIQLTRSPGLDDNPEYSPDGRHIFFNSERSGRMKVWRMNVDGSNPEQVTSGDAADWYPHPSPDGKHLAFLRCEGDVAGMPIDRPVVLCLLTLETGEIREISRFLGGMGSMNSPCWSPDGARIAYVRYELPQP